MESKDVLHFEFLSTKNSKFQIPNLFYFIIGALSVSAWFSQSSFQNNNIPFILLKFVVPIILLLKFVCANVVKIRRFLDFKKVNRIKDADHIFIQLNDDENSCYIVKLSTVKIEKLVYWFSIYQLKYIYDEEANKFFNPLYFKDAKFGFFAHFKPLNDKEIEDNHIIYGKNSIEMTCPSFFTTFKSKIISPSSIFNFFFMILCIAEGYRVSIFISFFLTIFDILVSTFNEMNYNKSFKSYETTPFPVKTFRNNSWVSVQTCDLVPGDMIMLDQTSSDNSISCDMIMIKGSCLVDESILTGESVPQIKESIARQNEQTEFNIDVHGKAHVVYSGTTLLTVTSSDLNNQKNNKNTCVAIVLRTGFYTDKGKLFRSLLFSIHNENINDKETYIYILLLFLFGCGTAAYTCIKRINTPNANMMMLFIHCVKLIVSAIPTDLSTKMHLFLQRMNSRLRTLNIFTMRVTKMPLGGKTDICFFDKTGTLTEDQILLEGVGGLCEDKVLNFQNLPIESIISLIGCTSVFNYKNRVIGDPIDTALIRVFRCTISDDCIQTAFPFSLTVKPCAKFSFESSLRRMSCVVVVQNPMFDRGYEYFCVVKGAPETLREMFEKVPGNYDELFNAYSAEGFRVIATGYKRLNSNTQQVQNIKRDQVESDLIFSGFLLSQSKIKDDSLSTISCIHKMHIGTIMISGDNPFTACHVSKEVGISNLPVLILSKMSNQVSEKYFWKGNGFEFEESVSTTNVKSLVKRFQFCITGDGLKYLLETSYNSSVLMQLLPYIRVFARFDPHQKEFIIKTYQTEGYVVLMCGDGANDIGALRMSDIGVAMINTPLVHKEESKPEKETTNKVVKLRKNKVKPKQVEKLPTVAPQENEEFRPGDASIAAPFTFKGPQVSRCLDFLKNCSCSLAYFQHIIIISTIYSITYVYMLSTHYSAGLVFSDGQQSLYGVFSMIIYYGTFNVAPFDLFPQSKPIKNLFHPYITATIVVQSLIHIYTIYYLSNGINIQFPVLDPLNEVQLGAKFEPSEYNTILYYYEFFVMMSINIVNYCGSPFSTPMVKNKTFIHSIIVSYFLLFGMLSNNIPYLSQYLKLVPLSNEILQILFIVIIVNFISVFAIDRILYFVFVKKIKINNEGTGTVL